MRRRAKLLLASALMAAACALALDAGGVLERYEADAIDKRFDVRGAKPADDIAVVAIDEKTFSELDSTWPLSRKDHAKVVDRLHEAGAKLIVYDVQFTEPSPDPEADLALFDALGRAGGAVLATGESDDEGNTAVLGGEEMLAEIDSIAAAANLPSDHSGVVRHYGREVVGVPTIAVAAAQRLGKAPATSDFDAKGHAYIDFRGGARTFPTFSFSDIHGGRFDAQRLRGKIVVVGAAAPTLQDVHPTSTTARVEMSGPEVQANAIWTAVHGNPLRDAPGWVGLLMIFTFAAVAPVVALRHRLGIAFAAVIAVAVAQAVVAQVAFEQGTVVPVVAPILALLIAAWATIGVSYASAVAERVIVARTNERLERLVGERTVELRGAQFELVRRLAEAAERRDGTTGEHIERMSKLCETLALVAGLPAAEAETLGHAAVLHDIGKIAIPDRILLKPGKLDADEWEEMKTHAAIGADMLAGSSSPMLQLAERIAITHHERWDGRGYPTGLQAETIPLAGRICAICDVFDALTSERPYKEAWSREDALAEIRSQAGKQFDPTLVEAFVSLFDESGRSARRRAVSLTA